MQDSQTQIENPTKSHTEKALTYCIVGERERREDQERTKVKKALFLEYWKKSGGVICVTCDMVNIDRTTFYAWKNDDPEFARAVQITEIERNTAVEDLLYAKIFVEKESASIRYYLDRVDPKYKPRQVSEVVVGDRTLEDLLDEAQKPNEQPGQQETDRGAIQDQGQAGANSTV